MRLAVALGLGLNLSLRLGRDALLVASGAFGWPSLWFGAKHPQAVQIVRLLLKRTARTCPLALMAASTTMPRLNLVL